MSMPLEYDPLSITLLALYISCADIKSSESVCVICRQLLIKWFIHIYPQMIHPAPFQSSFSYDSIDGYIQSLIKWYEHRVSAYIYPYVYNSVVSICDCICT